MCAHTGSYVQCMLESWSHPVGIRYECLRTDWQHIMRENELLLRGGIHTRRHSCTSHPTTRSLVTSLLPCRHVNPTQCGKGSQLWRTRRHCWQMGKIFGSEHPVMPSTKSYESKALLTTQTSHGKRNEHSTKWSLPYVRISKTTLHKRSMWINDYANWTLPNFLHWEWITRWGGYVLHSQLWRPCKAFGFWLLWHSETYQRSLPSSFFPLQSTCRWRLQSFPCHHCTRERQLCRPANFIQRNFPIPVDRWLIIPRAQLHPAIRYSQ